MTKCLPNHSWKSPQDLSIKSPIHKIENALRLKKQIIIAFSLFFVANLSAQSSKNILINEFLASNVSVDADIVDFDDYSDWIELYNAGDVVIENCDLSGSENFDTDAIDLGRISNGIVCGNRIYRS